MSNLVRIDDGTIHRIQYALLVVPLGHGVTTTQAYALNITEIQILCVILR